MVETAPKAGEAIPPELRIVEWQNEWVVESAFEFQFPAPDQLLTDLRQKYELDDVIRPGRTEFEQILLLREWVHDKWDHGWSLVLPETTNALDILREVERGNDFHCVYYAITFMQCLQAMGFVARRAGISKTATEWDAPGEGNVGHSMLEVYSHDFHKWVLLDADLNMHFERGGIPQSALEIHKAWVTRRWDEVRMVHGQKPFAFTRKRDSGYLRLGDHDYHEAMIQIFTWHELGDYAAHASVRMDNRHPQPEPATMVHWIDNVTPPKLIDRNSVNHNIWTGNEYDMYPTMDQVQIDLRVDAEVWERGEAVLDVALKHSMPNMEKLLVRIDHEPWHETPHQLRWILKPGKNEIMAKGTNTFGREGHISRVLLRYHP